MRSEKLESFKLEILKLKNFREVAMHAQQRSRNPYPHVRLLLNLILVAVKINGELSKKNILDENSISAKEYYQKNFSN